MKPVFLLALSILSNQTHAYIDTSVSPFNRMGLERLLAQNPSVTTLDQLPAVLPDHFAINFTLKHGLLRTGERGHLVEKKVSQSSDPQAPRAIIWDERSGFTVSYNGGLDTQTAAHRLDTLSFDDATKSFHLEQVDFPIQPGKPAFRATDCNTCHGPNNRPIFSMYPDWPSFYGSDNDELMDRADPIQRLELQDYQKFVREVVPVQPRYTPLYSAARIRKLLGVQSYSSFPYRQDVETRGSAITRAFAFRPSLRLGILMNRLNAQMLVKKVTTHANYSEFGNYFLFNLLQCRWSSRDALERSGWLRKVESALGEAPRFAPGDNLLHYRQLWKLFDLKVNDVDIRYSYNHSGYANDDASRKIMEVGYIGRYWNSYFDGSATIDELVAMHLYSDLQTKHSELRGKIKPDGLVVKYRHFTNRFAYDEKFFREMDRKGQWIPIPYPASVKDEHHRENFGPDYANQHAALCRSLENLLR